MFQLLGTSTPTFYECFRFWELRPPNLVNVLAFGNLAIKHAETFIKFDPHPRKTGSVRASDRATRESWVRGGGRSDGGGEMGISAEGSRVERACPRPLRRGRRHGRRPVAGLAPGGGGSRRQDPGARVTLGALVRIMRFEWHTGWRRALDSCSRGAPRAAALYLHFAF